MQSYLGLVGLKMAGMPAATRIMRPSMFVSRMLNTSSTSFSSKSPVLMKADTMKQVEVDEAVVQKKLGNINMDFVRKAEKRNRERAKMHRFFRRKDWVIASTCIGLVVGIYSYTIYAIQQEKFLEDFDMPEEIDRTKKEDK